MANFTEIISNIVAEGANEIVIQSAPAWIKILALIGAFSISMTFLSQGTNVITSIFYIIGFIKWFIEDIINKFVKKK